MTETDKQTQTRQSALSAWEKAAQAAGKELIDAGWDPPEYPIGDFATEGLNSLDDVVLVVGKRRTGKSWFMRDYLYERRKLYPYVFAFTMSKSNGYWQQYMPNQMIINRLDPNIIDKLVKCQESRVLEPGINPYVMLLLDDVAADSQLAMGEKIRDVAMNGRHRRFGAIISTQYLKSAGTKLRGNSDKIVLFTTSNLDILDAVYTEFGADFRSKWDFFAWVDRHTKDHQCIVINATDSNIRGKERYYVYKSRAFDGTPGQGPSKFSLCSDVCWGGKENRGRVLSEQRKRFRKPPDYTISTLKHMFNTSFITAKMADHNTKRVKELYDEDFEKIINAAPDSEDGRAQRHSSMNIYPRSQSTRGKRLLDDPGQDDDELGAHTKGYGRKRAKRL